MVWELHQKTINPIPFQLPEKRAKLQIHLYIKTFTYDTNIKIKKIYFNLSLIPQHYYKYNFLST